MANHDWIKLKEADLLLQAGANEKYFISLGSQFSPTELQRFKAAVTAFRTAFAKTSDKATSTRADVAAKNDAKKALIAIMREFYKKYVIGNTTMTNEQRETYEYPVYDTEPTPVPVPRTAPNIKIDFAQSSSHLVYFGKFNTEGKITRGLPKGAHGVEIRRFVVKGEPPQTTPDPEDMEVVGLATKSPKEVRYNKNAKDTKVYYAVRYFNDRGEYSLWSDVVLAIVN
ncbi:MAG: hypothetical protein LBO06_04545 [Bacteroidales bacterium]|jgi:hypothetical protein|nr:hypothetical protein [Bacteroidales bacterium]